MDEAIRALIKEKLKQGLTPTKISEMLNIKKKIVEEIKINL